MPSPALPISANPARSVLDRAAVAVDHSLLRHAVHHHGLAAVAAELGVDIPAVDVWMRAGIPEIFRRRVLSMAARPLADCA